MTYSKEEQKAHRKLWVEALRSGKYAQGEGILRSNVGFCCLGVACEISGLGTWADGGRYYVGVHHGYACLPDPVTAWLGISDRAGEFATDSLSGMNDAGKSFAELADIIESEPEGLVE